MAVITEMFAIIVHDPATNGDGIPAWLDPVLSAWMPMVCSTMDNLYRLRTIAGQRFGDGNYRIMRFAPGEDITQQIMDNG